MDDAVGRVLDHLEASGLSKNTVVIYSSDQGWYLGEHGWYDKRWMYEESLEMPFVARWPGRIPAGTRVPQMIQNIDYAPTFLELAGETVPADIQGNSLLGLMAGEARVIGENRSTTTTTNTPTRTMSRRITVSVPTDTS